MTDDEVDDYVRYLRAHMPPLHAHVSVAQVRAVLDAETEYFERRFGSIHSLKALLLSVFGRGEPKPERVEAALPEFEAYAVEKLDGWEGLTRDDIHAIMRVEGEAGPGWTPPVPPAPDEGASVSQEG